MAQSWRSSRALVVATACIAMFTETLLYGFLTPILPYMLQVRLHINPAETQNLTTRLLTIYGVVTLIASPFIASLADRTRSRKGPLLASLGTCLTGTLLVAFTPSLLALYAGRVLQGSAGSAAWIVCLAMLTENVDENDMGKMMGLCMSFVIEGTVGGPVVSGALLEWVGYWLAWLAPMGFLVLDIVARLVVADLQQPSQYLSSSSCSRKRPSGRSDSDTNRDSGTEISPLLAGTKSPSANTNATANPNATAEIEAQTATATENFYTFMLRDPRVLGSLANSIAHSSLIAAFNTTWPVHLHQIFNWGPAPVGAVFFTLQLPAVLLGPLSGWLRDRVGTRYPAAAGWALFAPFVWGLGLPGFRQLDCDRDWLGGQQKGKGLFIFCVAGIGIVQPLLQGAGFLNTIAVLKDIESKRPGLFGAHGGRSRGFAINEVGFNLGLILGPLVSGSLSELIGYFYMNTALGEFKVELRITCRLQFAVLCFG
ncbi:MFS transporter [Aspergillus undulatus]|uniref:MFS transporter n=1 Tax=Aspergillus undulatus TaxID=1810928 RepID=UPI003CCDF594